jgi:[acyl-carrier-protein] S-malonyltransferase
VARVAELVTAAKGRAIPLKVSAPFHCSLMAPAARVLEVELARIAVYSPHFPVVANVDARPNRDAGRVTDLLVRQVDQPVRWEESVRRMVEGGITHALEIGPGKVLAGLVKRIARDVKVLSVADAASLDAVEAFLSGSCTAPATRL